MENEQRGFNQNPYIQQENMGGMSQGRGQNSGGQNRGGGMGQQGGMKMGQGRGKNKQNSKMDNMQNPYYNTNNQMSNNKSASLYGDFDTANFIKGALLGAVGAYLLTNEKAQKTIFKTAVKGSEMFQTGMEEMKERFEDAKAEMEAEKQ